MSEALILVSQDARFADDGREAVAPVHHALHPYLSLPFQIAPPGCLEACRPTPPEWLGRAGLRSDRTHQAFCQSPCASAPTGTACGYPGSPLLPQEII